MHFSIYLISVLLVAISTDGLGLPPGWWCGTKPCDARMKEREDSRINNRAMSNTTAIDTALNNTAVTGRPITNTGPSRYTISRGWWCAVKKRQIGNPNTSNEASAAPPSRQALGHVVKEPARSIWNLSRTKISTVQQSITQRSPLHQSIIHPKALAAGGVGPTNVRSARKISARKRARSARSTLQHPKPPNCLRESPLPTWSVPVSSVFYLQSVSIPDQNI